MKPLLPLLCCLLMACSHVTETSRHTHDDGAASEWAALQKSYADKVGTQITVEGVVTNSKIPAVAGVEAAELRHYRGQRVKMTGVLLSYTITAEDFDRARGEIAMQAPGTYFQMENPQIAVVR